MAIVKGFLAKKVEWATWQLKIVKLAAGSLGIILGTYFAGFWKPWLPILWIVFAVTSIWAGWMWLGKMRKK